MRRQDDEVEDERRRRVNCNSSHFNFSEKVLHQSVRMFVHCA